MMTAEQLKNSIYQLAVGGKLVEQRSDEGTAEDLYKHILDKRESLLKNNEIKDIKGIEPIEDIPFDIPNSWKWVRLGNIASVISDGTHRTPTYVDEGIPFLSVQNISGGFIDMSKAKYITPEEHEALIQRCKPSKDDILVCRIGTLGKAIKINVDFEFSIFVSLGLLRLVDTRIADYVTCVINSGYGKKWIDEVKVGGGTHTNKINLNSFPNFLIPLPPLREQQRILNKLIEFDELLSEYAKASTRLNTLNASFPDQMKKSILQQAVMGKLVPQDPNDEPASVLLKKIEEEKQKLIKEGKIKKQKSDYSYSEEDIPFDIPDTWAWARLGSICHDLRYGTSSKSSPVGDVIVLRMGNIQNGEIDYSDLVYSSNQVDNEKYWLEPMDILFNRTNSRELVGKTGIYRGEHPAIFAGYLVQVRPILVNPEYLNFVMNSEYERNYCKDVKSDGINQANVNATKIGHFLIPIPPINEQRRIVERLNRILPAVAIYKAKMEKMTQ